MMGSLSDVSVRTPQHPLPSIRGSSLTKSQASILLEDISPHPMRLDQFQSRASIHDELLEQGGGDFDFFLDDLQNEFQPAPEFNEGPSFNETVKFM
jgi:hypothetical protein